MKKTMASMLILAVLSIWVPCASAEISQELDPMASPDAQATVTNDSSTNSVGSQQVSNVVSTADATGSKKAAAETKKEKSKKSSKKKSTEKKKTKSSEPKKKKTSSKKRKSATPVKDSTL